MRSSTVGDMSRACRNLHTEVLFSSLEVLQASTLTGRDLRNGLFEPSIRLLSINYCVCVRRKERVRFYSRQP